MVVFVGEKKGKHRVILQLKYFILERPLIALKHHCCEEICLPITLPHEYSNKMKDGVLSIAEKR